MNMRCSLLAGFALVLCGADAMAQGFNVVTRNDIAFAEHDGTKLVGDLYAPRGRDKAPLLVAVHGGGWQAGTRKSYAHWGPYLAENGYAVFSIEYRLSKPGVKTHPGAVYDVKAAGQDRRAHAPGLGGHPEGMPLAHDYSGRPFA